VSAVLGERSPARGRAYFIGQERPVNLWEFIDRVVAEAGCPPIRRRLSAPAAMRLAGLMELAYGRLGLPGEPPLTRLMVHQMTRSHWFDHSAAQRDFGYGPRISIEEGLRRTLHAG
jgi:nucleoside-diphosphate-sugar epimerase